MFSIFQFWTRDLTPLSKIRVLDFDIFVLLCFFLYASQVFGLGRRQIEFFFFPLVRVVLDYAHRLVSFLLIVFYFEGTLFQSAGNHCC